MTDAPCRADLVGVNRDQVAFPRSSNAESGCVRLEKLWYIRVNDIGGRWFAVGHARCCHGDRFLPLMKRFLPSVLLACVVFLFGIGPVRAAVGKIDRWHADKPD